jgi:hypothetical protein
MTKLGRNLSQLRAMLTLETVCIFFYPKNDATNLGRISFDKGLDWGTNLKNWGPIGRMFAITFSVTVPQISAG